MEWIAGIVGAVIGAGGILLLEKYKRADDRRGIASAIAGEISALVQIAEVRKLPEIIAELAKAMRSPTPTPPPWPYFDADFKPTPVLEAYLSRIGALGGRLPERVIYFYSLYAAIRLDAKIVASGVLNSDPLKAAYHLDSGIALWKVAQPHAKTLVEDLQAFSDTD